MTLVPSILDMPASTSKKAKKARRAVLNTLNTMVVTFKKHFLYDSIVQQFFYQVFYFMNCNLFNELIDQGQKLCNCASGFEIAISLSHYFEWAEKNLSALPRDQLFPHIHQASQVLVMDKKIMADRQTLEDIFPALNFSQIDRLITLYKPDNIAPDPVPKETKDVIKKLHEADPQDVKLDESLFATMH